MKKLSLLLVILLASTDFALGATSKPSPKAVITIIGKPTPKASAKPTSGGKVQATSKSTALKKKRVYKRTVRKKVKPLKSPAPKWPPANFTNSGSIYAKIPSAQELDSYASNSSYITMGLSYCEKYACGSVFLASETGCSWWQIDAMVSGPSKTNPNNRETYGTIQTLESGSRAKKIVAVLLKSKVELQDGISVGGITARCWSTARPDNVPSNTYTPNTGASSAPSN